MMRVLVVEDTPDIAAAIQDHLIQDGCETRIAGTGEEALATFESWMPDVVLLDLMLPGITGYDVLRQMRAAQLETPVLILSAKSDEMAKIRGFRTGGDDFVTKPFSMRELAARVQALGRRVVARQDAPAVLRFGEIEVRPLERRVLRGGTELALRPKEYDLLLTLIAHPNQVVSRKHLLSHAWAYDPSVESRTVDWHVAELRRKLGDDASAPRLLVTVRKVGYRWIGGSGSG